MNTKLGCLDVVELVTDRIENALPDDERRPFEGHRLEQTRQERT